MAGVMHHGHTVGALASRVGVRSPALKSVTAPLPESHSPHLRYKAVRAVWAQISADAEKEKKEQEEKEKQEAK